MKSIEQRLNVIKQHVDNNHIRIMILGLGSVGLYLLDYIISSRDEAIEIIVVGRNDEKMQSDVNIVKVSSLIRGLNKSNVIVESGVDFDSIESIQACFEKYQPDFVVNSSRVYSGLKYGSISWNNLRAYGIWAPLAIKYVKNIMEACDKADSNAIIINTSYSDAVIPWLKSAGKSYPDFGSGNVNHLIPRIKLAVAESEGIKDYWNIDVTFATSHFHDVVISKEGHTEGIEQLISIEYNNKKLEIDILAIFEKCKIAMPVDKKRNMMNASSNYEIIMSIIEAIRTRKKVKFHSPGALGYIGGYPVIVDGKNDNVCVYIDDSKFKLEDMINKNRESIYMDGIQSIENGTLFYTDELIEKVQKVFQVTLTKQVKYEDIQSVAEFLITEIIEKNK